MRREGPRGTWLGLAAIIGYCCLLFWGTQLVIFLTHFMAMWWSGTIYGLAFSMGVLQLIFVMWGNGRVLRAVRFDRSREYPPGQERREGQ